MPSDAVAATDEKPKGRKSATRPAVGRRGE